MSNREFKVADGCKVPHLTGIEEGYGIDERKDGKYHIIVNVSVERLREVFLGLSALVSPPTFGIIECPTREPEEKKLWKDGSKVFHRNVYYRDNTSIGDLTRIFSLNPDLFVHDGMTTFGFARKNILDEVFVGKYKILKILTTEPQKYIQYLDGLGLELRVPLKTVWDNFSDEVPGKSIRMYYDGEDIYGLIDRLKSEGFFFFDYREEE